MRTSLLLLPALLSLTLHAQTPFAPVGAQWTYTVGSWAGPEQSAYTLEVIGDTVLQGRTASVLSSTGLVCSVFADILATSNDSLFYWDRDAQQFQLLFRWDAQLGDTWSTPVRAWAQVDTLQWSVQSISTMMVDGSALRKLNVNCVGMVWMDSNNGGAIVEDLGPLRAPFSWIPGNCDAETLLGLRCYTDPVIDWLNPQYPQCGLGPDPGAAVVPAGAMWSYNGTHWEDHGVMVEVPHITQLTCTGVDVVHGRLCSVLDDGGGFCNYTPSLLNMRGDTVFFWSEMDSAFNTLYVMNTPIGGSWTSTSPFGDDYYDITWTVLDTGSLIVDGITLRQLVVQSDFGSQGTITDKLGSSNYITPWNWGMIGGCDMGDDDGLRCYSDLQISWMDPQYNSCLLLGIDEAADPSLLSIHPNPAGVGETITLRFNEVGTDLHLEVTDALGREVYRATIQEMTTELRLPTAGFYAIGVYRSGQRLMVGKVVVY